MTWLDKLYAERDALGAEVERLIIENQKLRAALKPFAKACDIYWPTTPDEYRFSDDELLVVSDLRAAKAALGESDD